MPAVGASIPLTIILLTIGCSAAGARASARFSVKGSGYVQAAFLNGYLTFPACKNACMGLTNGQQPEGLKDISRGLRSGATIPPVNVANYPHPERVTESGIGQRFLPPLQGGKHLWDAYRGYRSQTHSTPG